MNDREIGNLIDQIDKKIGLQSLNSDSYCPIRPKYLFSIRIDSDILYWFKSKGSGYQKLINEVLRRYKDMVEVRNLLDCRFLETEILAFSFASLKLGKLFIFMRAGGADRITIKSISESDSENIFYKKELIENSLVYSGNDQEEFEKICKDWYRDYRKGIK